MSTNGDRIKAAIENLGDDDVLSFSNIYIHYNRVNTVVVRKVNPTDFYGNSIEINYDNVFYFYYRTAQSAAKTLSLYVTLD